MSLYDYTATLHFWAKAHSTEQEAVALAPGEYDEMMAAAEAVDWEALKPAGVDNGNAS